MPTPVPLDPDMDKAKGFDFAMRALEVASDDPGEYRGAMFLLRRRHLSHDGAS
jgi:hypothetical protein